MKGLCSIEQEIGAIFAAIAGEVSDNLKAVKERPVKGASCRGMVCVYDRRDLKRAEEDRHYKPVPVVRYALYPDVYCPSRLGSVAIYADNAEVLCRALRRQGSLFGHAIRDVWVDFGRRPYVDVRLR